MATLVIHAPSNKLNIGSEYKSFQQVLDSHVAKGYGIYDSLRGRIGINCRVVVIDKDKERRAEGTLTKLEKVEKAANGVQRYDVHIGNDLAIVDWKPESLNRCGVDVID